ncbi:MAG: 1-deoxy-D-xylulose-5-phosphate reductoisomerase [Bacteroidetes bacterium]|nr:1-deoxy-D-xylulose-5-phosphate reductoisomerase [Bacteroidota bacterium]
MGKHIAILGSTGSIGKQALEVIASHPEEFVTEVITAHSNATLLIEQALQCKPNAVVIGNEAYYPLVREALEPAGIKVFAGEDSLSQIVEMDTIDMVLNALVGYLGLRPTLRAIHAGKNIALANKESLVVAGEMVTRLAAEKMVNIIPVDSEHSAIFQCLAGEHLNPVEKIYLTASGGPFRGKDLAFLEHVSKEEALRHPNWKMGHKITIDSSSLMNKGLEVIEARWLFDLPQEQIDVIVHPQSIIHSMVQFADGSMKAQMGLPDMRIPIQYALSYPNRLHAGFPRLNFMDYPQLTFEPVDTKLFRNLSLAYTSLDRGGNAPCILNAANEVAVEAFLLEQIGFMAMPDLIGDCLDAIPFTAAPSYEDYCETDRSTREYAWKQINKKQ